MEKFTDIIECIVSKIDYIEQKIILEVDDMYPDIENPRLCITFGKSSVYDSGNYKAKPRVTFTDDAMKSIPSGMTYLPRVGDAVIVAIRRRVDLQDMSSMTKIDNAVIIGTISNREGHRPRIFPYDKMWLDESGAKVHINHVWGDKTRKEVEMVTTQNGEQVKTTYNIPPPTGHMTTLGNRRVELFGGKFLPFGLHSHTYDSFFNPSPEEKVTIPPSWDYETDPEKGKSKKWGEIFTYDILSIWDGSLIVYEPSLTSSKGLSEKGRFLQPPCPENGEYMLMGDSGYQLYVNRVGQERQIKRNSIQMIGSSVFVLAYDPLDDFGHGMVMPTHDEVGGELKFWLAGADNEDLPTFISMMKITGGNVIDNAGLLTMGFHGIRIECPDDDEDDSITTSPEKPDWVDYAVKGKIIFSVGTTNVIIDGIGKEITIDANGKKIVVNDTKITITGNVDINGDLAVTGAVTGATGDFGA